jgi:type IV pilus assembly protein PilM
MTKEQAELAKRSGEVSEDYPAAVLEPFKQSVASQIDNALQFFFSSSHYNAVDKIILVGGVAMIPGLDQVVSTQLTIPTMVGNPFENMESAKRVNRRSLERDAPLFAVACGLALRSLD